MANYTIIMSCGHEDTVSLYGKYSERQRKIEYFQNKGLCKQCYKKKMEEEMMTETLTFHASVLPYIDEVDGGFMLSVWFGGNTKPYKDKIKLIGGYRWSQRKSESNWYTYRTPLCWNKIIKLEALDNEAVKAKSLGADIDQTIIPDTLYEAVNYRIALMRHQEWIEQQEVIKKIVKPNAPDVLIGHKWNQTVYGKSGNYTVYLDGEKTYITNEQAEEIKEYVKNKEKYQQMIQRIKKFRR